MQQLSARPLTSTKNVIKSSCCFPSIPVKATESELGDVDLSGLPEAAVDSEEEEEEDEDLERASDALLGRDLVRECLEKEPADRNDDDIGQCSSISSIVSNFALWRVKGCCLRNMNAKLL